MNLWEGIDDRPPELRKFTQEEEKRILEELKQLREKKAKTKQVTAQK